jgi:hypothetical protein
MNISVRQSNIRTIRQGDPKFTLIDGFVVCPRAGFEINEKCPREYKLIIAECINNGWIKPVAHVTERELLFIGLTE